jgi:hypothetical protein
MDAEYDMVDGSPDEVLSTTTIGKAGKWTHLDGESTHA